MAIIQILGALLTIGGTSAWGLLGVLKLRRRSRDLAELCRTVAALRSELVTRLAPVPELIAHLAAQADEPIAAFLREVELHLPSLGEHSLFEIWQTALTAAPQLKLTPPERAAFMEIPRALGRYELAEQRNALQAVQRTLERFANDAEQRRRADSKTRGFIGIAAGVFVVLILL